MNIIKFGGSIVNPDGKYDNKVINEFINLVKKSSDKFLFVVGGGKICRNVQSSAQPFLKESQPNQKMIHYGNDWLGIATTKINANYVLTKFKEKFKDQVYPEIILDPTVKIKSSARIFFTGGWKPGHSTDTDMMLMAETFGADKVFKISDFPVVKNVRPLDVHGKSKEEMKKILAKAEDIEEMTWQQLADLVGTEWIPGLNTPFDPIATKIGLKLRKKLSVYICRKEEFPKALLGKPFLGTVVKG